MAKASARHILVDSEAKCEELKQQIEVGPILPRLPKLIQPVRRDAVVAISVNLAEDKWSRSLTKLFSVANLIPSMGQSKLNSATTCWKSPNAVTDFPGFLN